MRVLRGKRGGKNLREAISIEGASERSGGTGWAISMKSIGRAGEG